jgi:cytochrome c biogenesis protein CcmG, thiol:disulfide interchange protein DsbE
MRRASSMLVVCAVAVAGWCAPVSASDLVGRPAGSLVLKTIDGKAFDLRALHGKVVLVSYWATWCEPCREEMPTLSTFYRRYHARGLEMIAISVDRPRDRPRVVRASKVLSYPTAMLNEIAVDGFEEPDGVPLTWVIDRNGMVRNKLIAVDEQLLAKTVLPLLPSAPGTKASSDLRPDH